MSERNLPPATPAGRGPQAAVRVLEHPHPGPRVYITIAVILATITAIEVAVYYISSLRPVMVPLLLLLSASKFSLVVMFYMHLRFDSRLFSGLFLLGLFVAMSIIVVLMAIFAFHTVL